MGRSFNSIAVRAAIHRFLDATPYYGCLLLVSPAIRQLQAAQDFVSEAYGWPLLSLGKVLANGLMPVPEQRRPRHVQRLLREAINAYHPGPVLCSNVDLLFHPSLQQDPLRLLRDASRHTRLFILWPGTFENDVLAYAVEKHDHYRTWPDHDLSQDCIVNL